MKKQKEKSARRKMRKELFYDLKLVAQLSQQLKTYSHNIFKLKMHFEEEFFLIFSKIYSISKHLGRLHLKWGRSKWVPPVPVH